MTTRTRLTGVPEPGIYDTCGTVRGEECLIAYDNDGECQLDHGPGAYGRLEGWLRARGVKLRSSRPALFLT